MTWQTIDSAPKDGRILHVRRVIDGRAMFEGLASWRTVHFPKYDDLPGGEAYDATGWMKPDIDKRFPEPTHWQAE